MQRLRRGQYAGAQANTMWWTADSPIRKPIPPNPSLDPDTATIVSYLAAHPGGSLNCTLWGAPIYHATSSTPRVSVARASSLDSLFGALPTDGWSVPIDPTWWPASEDDGHISIIDTDGTEYSFWQFVNGITPQAGGAGIADTKSAVITSGYGGATASQFGRAAGLIRVEEWERGYIDHALFLTTSLTRIGTPPPFRFPALHSDGKNLAGAPVTATIAMGTRLQLDPAFNVDDKTEWPGWVRMAAKAMQTYGLYVGDTGGSIFGLLGEIPRTTTGAGAAAKHNNQRMYTLGIDDQYSGLPADFPWTSLRVLASWDDTVPAPALAKIATLQDTFPGPGLNRAYIWKQTNCVAVTVSNHQAVIPQTSSYTNALISGWYDCTETAVFARVVPALGGNDSYTTSFAIRQDANNSAALMVSGSSLIWVMKTAGVATNTTIGAYDALQHAWLRVRESGGVFYGDTSPDGKDWTQRAASSHTWPATQAQLFVVAGYWKPETAAESYVSNVNTAL